MPTWAIMALLAAATVVLYRPALHCDFVYYDDTDYVTENPAIQHGLTLAGVRWAFATLDAANWHPLTWLSLMLDASVFGLQKTARRPAAIAST